MSNFPARRVLCLAAGLLGVAGCNGTEAYFGGAEGDRQDGGAREAPEGGDAGGFDHDAAADAAASFSIDAGRGEELGACAAECEQRASFCDLAKQSCVECLAAADCEGQDRTCADGICVAKPCRDEDCAAGASCGADGCTACEGTVVDGNERGECFAGRGPRRKNPLSDSDGCSAERFLEAVSKVAPVPDDEASRRAIMDDPVKFVTDGVCSAPFGYGGKELGACELHDACYSVCRASRSRCDSEFLRRMVATCTAKYRSDPCRGACIALADIYGAAVAHASEGPYLNDQDAYCACCPSTPDCGDGVCEVSIGETVDNCRDCLGDFSNGDACITDNDCASKHCGVHGECAPKGLADGSPCTTGSACASGVCTAGTCVECASEAGCPAQEHCNLAGKCVADLGNDGVCTANAECRSGICSAGLCAECVRDDGCGPGKHCDLFGDCKNDLGNNAVCTANTECVSGICSAGFCAQCTRDSQCIASKHCNLFGDCIDDLDNGGVCTADAECKSGRCLGVCVGF